MQKKIVLIAEDELAYRKILQRSLEEEGVSVETVGNGSELLASLAKAIPDLLLLDLVMPVMDGFHALKEIRSNKTFENLKIIALSNLGQDEDMDKARKLGVNDYIIKSNESLSDVVSKVLNYLG